MEDAVVLQSEPQAESAAPLLRTILLADICDSTNLVERLGDGGAAQFFREHDRLVLRLQQQWRGRLIDRADGLLLLFKRPVDGLGFALDYARGLADIGKLRHLDIKTRSGLHVGEVLTWRNSDEAVRLGAKPIEVEGLAKPIAARLMSIARPGQILMSAVAEPLAHRSARELGERGQNLVWKSHGLWQFKGVAERQLVFEVGEPGLAPLRAPGNSTKAWRRLPLWRRPAALMAEAAVLVAVTFGAWFATRTPPAIAFNERDWVVVGDLRNLTGDIRLEDSLEQAFRISLEQSRHVNVLSDLKVRDSLARMRLEPGTVVDRDIASQIAQRDGARAVILPTVSEIGGRLRFSVEVVDPRTQTTVYAHAADGKGEESALASIDEVSAAVRANLGEAVKQIDKDSRPLPEVTTGNLDALRAYALGQEAYGARRFSDALSMFQKAAEIDPDFALAWIGQLLVHYSTVNAPAAMDALKRAKTLRGQLPQKEALYLDAWVSEFERPKDSTRNWIELATLYPDYLPAQGNAAIWLYEENRFKEAARFAEAAAVDKNYMLGPQLDMLGRVQLGLERYADAEQSFSRSARISGGSVRRLAATAAAQRKFTEANQYLERLGEDDAFGYIEKVSIAVDQERWGDAQRFAEMSLAVLGKNEGAASRYLQVPSALARWKNGDAAGARMQLHAVIRRSLDMLSKGSPADAKDDVATALAAALVATRMGDYGAAERVASSLASFPQLMEVPQFRELSAVLRAELLRRKEKDSAGAIQLLLPFLNGNERFQTRVALMDANSDVGDEERAMEHARWLRERRGLAYIEIGCGYCMQALNVLDSNRALQRSNNEFRGERRSPDPVAVDSES